MSLETFEKLPADRKELILQTGIREFAQRSYKDVSTDTITKQCRISKGILFHYFGSKKGYYLYCLKTAMERLCEKQEESGGEDFYEILFDSMNRKISKCAAFKDEMHMVNMASRDASAEIAVPKAELLQKYAETIHGESSETLEKALESLRLKAGNKKKRTVEGLQIYINAILNKYLLQYQQEPDQFFENSGKIRKEIREYLDLMLYGICG